MLSEKMKERYMEAFDAFSNHLDFNEINVKHRSQKKFEDGTNRDISIYYEDTFVCGIYVGKENYKLYLRNENWYSQTSGRALEMNEDGWYAVLFEDLEKCVKDVKCFILIRQN